MENLSDEHEKKNEGVPQGSVLSYILFTLAINGITQTLPHDVKCSLNVDDLGKNLIGMHSFTFLFVGFKQSFFLQLKLLQYTSIEREGSLNNSHYTFTTNQAYLKPMLSLWRLPVITNLT